LCDRGGKGRGGEGREGKLPFILNIKALQRFYMDLCQYCIAIIAGNRPSQGVNTCPVRALTPVQALISVNAWIEKINALTGLQYLI